jgi:ribonuclease HII
MGRKRDGKDMLRLERKLWGQGLTLIAGVDEAGRGALAGPLVAAAVILPSGLELPGVRDSKKLTPSRREELYGSILERSLSWSWSCISPNEIDTLGLARANLLALREAVLGLAPMPEMVLVDHYIIPDLDIPMLGVAKGDAISQSIAAASILAKVIRDRLMRQVHFFYPQYGFSRHKGYGTSLHLEALRIWGPCPLHRRSYRQVSQQRMVF